ncbi:MAG: phosphoribosyltransferase [Peptococcaceae bacterium BICA1-7]|nr:MAG: phosphoribosyltransferase [Peptococcaceae bacterium BICA1-7]
MFRNRDDAGDRLAREIEIKNPSSAVVLCIPRGGVVVGERVSRSLGVPLDIIVPRKIGSPVNQEVALGAVAQDGSTYLNGEMIALLGIENDDIEEIIDREVREIERRMTGYRGSAQYPDFSANTLILVDDGAATGYTMLAAARFVRGSLNPASLMIALPVAPPDTLDLFARECDQVVCLYYPEEFYSVGQFYDDFDQTSDEEVLAILKGHRAGDAKNHHIL